MNAAAKTTKPMVAAAAGKTVKSNTVAVKTAELIRKVTQQRPLEAQMSQMTHVSSGIMLIDHMIGGAKAKDGSGDPVCPGFPRKFITELYGAESSGKTSVAIRAAVEVQRAGGTVMFLDYEHALHHGYASQIGLDFDPTKLLLYTPNTLEEGLKMMYIGIKTGVDLIIIDSVAAMVPATELAKGVDEVAKIGALAKAFSEQLPKIAQWLAAPPAESPKGTALVFINQTRAVINAGHGDPENTSGGKALKFFAYCRLKLTRIRTDSLERKDSFTGKVRKFPFGNLVQVKVVKNKVSGTQGHTGDIFIRFGYGPDEYHTAIEAGTNHKVIKKEGAWFAYETERFQGKDKLRNYFLANPKVFAEAQAKILKALLDTAPTAIADEDLEEEDDILSSMKSEFGAEVETTPTPEETIVTEG